MMRLHGKPHINVSKVTNMTYMFEDCKKVKSGSLALYQAASSTGKVTSYNGCFYRCGAMTETGAAELAQIPETWRGRD